MSHEDLGSQSDGCVGCLCAYAPNRLTLSTITYLASFKRSHFVKYTSETLSQLEGKHGKQEDSDVGKRPIAGAADAVAEKGTHRRHALHAPAERRCERLSKGQWDREPLRKRGHTQAPMPEKGGHARAENVDGLEVQNA